MATAVATLNDGFEWRTLLGNTHQWTLPPLPLDPQPTDSVDRCALCGEPIGDRPFATNSAGEFPTHLKCTTGGWTDPHLAAAGSENAATFPAEPGHRLEPRHPTFTAPFPRAREAGSQSVRGPLPDLTVVEQRFA
jgi:hypothetical protein